MVNTSSIVKQSLNTKAWFELEKIQTETGYKLGKTKLNQGKLG